MADTEPATASSEAAESFDPPLNTSLLETSADRRWDEITAELGEIAGQINSLFGRVTQIAADVEAENLLAGTSLHSVALFLEWQLGLSRTRARQLAKIGNRRGELPEVTALLDQGLLSADQVAPIAARLPGVPEADRHFAELAPNLAVHQIRKAVQATVPPDQTPDTDTDPDPGADVAGPRSVSFGHRDDGTWQLTLTAGTADGASFETALRACHDALWNDHKKTLETLPEDVEPPPAPTWFDAFARMSERSLEREATQRPHSQRTKVIVHVRAGDDLAQLHLGPALSAAQRAMLTCDASIATVLEHHATPVSCGREHRIVPDKTRILVEHRDNGCAIPWCGTTKHLVIHHIIHWEHGGATDTHNLISLCPHHHRAVHADTLTITGNADTPGALTITDHRKQRITGQSAARAPDHQIPPPPNPYRHPWGTGINWRDYMPPHLTPPRPRHRRHRSGNDRLNGFGPLGILGDSAYWETWIGSSCSAPEQ